MTKAITANRWRKALLCAMALLCYACNTKGPDQKAKEYVTAETLLGNPNYPAISYGGYRTTSREVQPTIAQLKNDVRILYALGYRLLRTYNLQFPHTPNLIQAISELKKENPSFEMYVMLGTWIDCKNAWTDSPDHREENLENNQSEINNAVRLANAYPDIIKIIAVGNEAMVHWATAYFVESTVILKWVRYLQGLKQEGKLPKKVWITSSDNFASWGGGDSTYHKEGLTQLIQAVDYLSIHTYPFHDTHYNPTFWEEQGSIDSLSVPERIDNGMEKAVAYAIDQYKAVEKHMTSLGIDKPIHIGETGWSTASNGLYGAKGSQAADEYKQALYYKKINQWSVKNNITTVFFSAFDESWKDPNGPEASENNFGLFTLDGKAKYALWDSVDQGVFDGLSREVNGPEIQKSFEGNTDTLMSTLLPPKTRQQ